MPEYRARRPNTGQPPLAAGLNVPRTSDDFGAPKPENRASLDVALVSDPLPGPLSPELVLVSPPEVRRFARGLLSPSPPAARHVPPAREREAGSIELAAVWLFCLAMTVGPMIFMLLASS
jgi:hypothetical protein